MSGVFAVKYREDSAFDLTPYLDRYSYFPILTRLVFEETGPRVRARGYMTREELAIIFVWKTVLWQIDLPGGGKVPALESDESKIEETTEKIFRANHSGRQEVKNLLESLVSTSPDGLRGVGFPVATAILSAIFPERYGAVDRHVGSALEIALKDTNKQPRIDGFVDAVWAMRRIAKVQETLSVERHWTPRMVDMALYELDKLSG